MLISCLKTYYRNDIRRIRIFTRFFRYKFENYEFFRLIAIRSKMIFHRYIDKNEEMKNFDPSKEDWKWSIHIKPIKFKRYGRFWKPSSHPKNEK